MIYEAWARVATYIIALILNDDDISTAEVIQDQMIWENDYKCCADNFVTM